MRRIYYTLLLLVLSGIGAGADSTYPDALVRQAQERGLARERLWHVLLHYRRDIWGRYRSDIDDARFFLSKTGGRDPEAELEATLRAFFDPPPADANEQSAPCRFPARFAWLKKELAWDSLRLPDQACPRFEEWRGQMRPAAAALVFASYYMNNPASMYGHTFLRLNKESSASEAKPLLDYTVNFSADVTTQNGLAFAVYGLTGLYRGRFSTLPYYMKVQEYSNMESRDLWEYRLTLSPESIDRLTRHLWEMGGASMAYFFFNKNCSYQLLPLLEVADPSLHLIEPFRFKAIPADTLRAVLQQRGLVSDVALRPSHLHKMLAARESLTAAERGWALQVARRPDVLPPELASQPIDRQERVLDSAHNLLRYRIGFKRDQPAEFLAQEQKLLLARSRLHSPTPSPSREEEVHSVPPQQGHRTGRLALGFGWSKLSRFEEVAFRPAAHDLDDDPRGYLAGSQMQMFQGRVRHLHERGTVYLENFMFLDLVSLSSWDSWVRHPSWKINTGLSTAHDVGHDPEDSLQYGVNAGAGFAHQFSLWRQERVYALAEMDMGAGEVFRDWYRWGGGGTAGVQVDLASFWRVRFQMSLLHYPLGDVRTTTRLQLVNAIPLGKDWQIRGQLERQNQYKEAVVSVARYW